VSAQVAGRLDRGPQPPAADHLGRHVSEQARWQADGPDSSELGDLGQHRVQADVARVCLDGGQHIAAVAVGLVLDGDERLQPADDGGVEPACHHGDHCLLGLVQRRTHDLGDPPGGRRLDELGPAPGQERLADPVLPPIGLGYVPGQPVGELVGVDNAALSKSGVTADLGAVPLGRAAGQVVGREIARRDAHLTGDVVHGIVGQLVTSPREPAAPQQELKGQGEPEPGRSRLVPEQVQLVADKGEVVDHLVEAQCPDHGPPLLTRQLM
jgi:hypothetical protein